jgi:hypothetical protein
MATSTTRSRAAMREAKGRGNGAEAVEAEETSGVVTEEDLRAQASAEIEAAYEEAMTAPEQVAPNWVSPEVAEVQGWWDIAAFGPVQPIAPGGPLVPHSVIKVGEPAFVFAFILLNPFLALPGGTNPAQVLSNFALPYQVQYQTGNLTSWTLGQADMQGLDNNNLIPGQNFYQEVIGFTATTPGLYEMNITARLLGAAPPFVNAPLFGARATTVFSLDPPGLFGAPPPGPLRFSIYP